MTKARQPQDGVAEPPQGYFWSGAAQDQAPSLQGLANGNRNKLLSGDRAAHEWYRFVLSFPPQLVRHYLGRFGITENETVLDPFCGTGTTLVECKKLGIPSLGLEAHPMAAFASRVKTDWTVAPDALMSHAHAVTRDVTASPTYRGAISRTLKPDAKRLLLRDSISPVPLHKTLVLMERLRADSHLPFYKYEALALARGLVTEIGNLHFGPEVGVRGFKEDAPVIDIWRENLAAMARDLKALAPQAPVRCDVFHEDARRMPAEIPAQSVSAVITSPPYPNEKDYTRTTRLESVILGFMQDLSDLRRLKQGLLRSNTRNVYKHDSDDHWVQTFVKVQRIADEIETRRKALGKTSGFERQYHRVTTLYFGGMARHLAELRRVLQPGARLAYVVGDQASYLQVMIRTGQLLAELAETLGYSVESLDLFRTRLSTATKQHLREEVLVLRWPEKCGRTLDKGRT